LGDWVIAGLWLGATLWAVASIGAASAGEPTLATVLDRAGAYVAEFHRQLSSLVGEETYVQEWKTVWSSHGRAGTTNLEHRVTRGDLLLIKPPGADAWLGYRDVYDVDGTPIHNRDERLVTSFLDGSLSTDARIKTILDESARYNIGDIQRNVNWPMYPLLFLERPNQFRFRFKVTTDRRLGAPTAESAPSGAFRVSTEVWAIEYDEKAPGTMIRTDHHKDLPSHGRFWIEPATGRVLMSELAVQNRALKATIDVSYQSEPLLGLLVPIEMHELYEGRRNNSRIEAVATYGRFRPVQRK
jgi:hypothetical protein